MTTQAAESFPLPPDIEGFYLWDRLHCPRPLTPLEHELLLISTGTGFSNAIGELGSAIVAVTRSINYYNYLTGVPRDLHGEDREQRKARYEKNVQELLPKLGDRWQNEWLPGMLPGLERARNTDFAALSDDELMRAFDQMAHDVVDRWTVHGYLLYSFYVAGLFADFYRENIEPEDPNEGYEALQGFESKALESSRGLWRLSRMARANPELRELFETLPSEQLLERIKALESAREFMNELNAYLDEFGWRSDSVYELTRPSWREDPSIPLGAVQGYVGIGDEFGPEPQYKEAVERREQLLAIARSKLAGKPDKLRHFEELYEAARSFTPIVEDHNHYIDQMGDITLRYPALEIGRRLVAKGSIAAPDDVFLLHVAEIREAMQGKDFKALTGQRRKEMEHFAQVIPPPAIGVPPPPTDPVEDVLFRFFGAPVEPSSDPAVLKGTAASPGVARGTAKVVRSLNEASKLSPGDIMVCEMTLPPWTPLFSTVSAVVSDTGGILSHCAIVAREYRIPCVVGTGMGTNVIKDGMIVTVDGSAGIVRIES